MSSVGDGTGPDKDDPVFITNPDETDRLIFNPLCVNNLSVYLTRKLKTSRRSAGPRYAKGCDIKTSSSS